MGFFIASICVDGVVRKESLQATIQKGKKDNVNEDKDRATNISLDTFCKRQAGMCNASLDSHDKQQQKEHLYVFCLSLSLF